MNRHFLLFLSAISLFSASCSHKSETYKLLVEVDSLILGHHNSDSAIQLLNKIEPKGKEESAYYNILEAATSFKGEKPVKSFDGINASIQYYTDNYDARKLAYAYYYKSTIFINKDSLNSEMISLFKNAEQHALKTNDYQLLDRVYSGLFFTNSTFEENDEALKCAHKELKYAQKQNDNYSIAYALINLAFTHHYMAHDTDSVAYYIRQCETLADDVDAEDKYYIYNYIGLTLMQDDPSSAKQYFLKALKFKKQIEAYMNLAKILFAENKHEEALKYCDSALLIKPNLVSREETYMLMAEYYYKSKDIEQYKKIIDELINTKAKLSQYKDNRKLLELQQKFDFEKQRAEYNSEKMLLISLISLLTALVAALILFHKVRLQKIREHDLALENQNAQLYGNLMTMTANEENYKKQIVQLEAENQNLASQKNDLSRTISSNKARITILQDKVDKLNTQKYEYVEVGKTIYRRIEQNQPITMFDDKWANCVYYFAMNIDNSFFDDYSNLTINDKVFLIADIFLTKTDDEIAEIFAISSVTVRSRRSKIKKKRVEVAA
ncbi:MAG: hypothetical protein IKP62_05335 [Salinivirgaceae bacterium]|nr:hypothetical protein [Salinivirgaceae bacterium]